MDFPMLVVICSLDGRFYGLVLELVTYSLVPEIDHLECLWSVPGMDDSFETRPGPKMELMLPFYSPP